MQGRTVTNCSRKKSNQLHLPEDGLPPVALAGKPGFGQICVTSRAGRSPESSSTNRHGLYCTCNMAAWLCCVLFNNKKMVFGHHSSWSQPQSVLLNGLLNHYDHASMHVHVCLPESAHITGEPEYYIWISGPNYQPG